MYYFAVYLRVSMISLSHADINFPTVDVNNLGTSYEIKLQEIMSHPAPHSLTLIVVLIIKVLQY